MTLILFTINCCLYVFSVVLFSIVFYSDSLVMAILGAMIVSFLIPLIVPLADIFYAGRGGSMGRRRMLFWSAVLQCISIAGAITALQEAGGPKIETPPVVERMEDKTDKNKTGKEPGP